MGHEIAGGLHGAKSVVGLPHANVGACLEQMNVAFGFVRRGRDGGEGRELVREGRELVRGVRADSGGDWDDMLVTGEEAEGAVG